MGGKRKGVLFTVLASLMFGVTPVFIKLVLEYTNIETANILLTAFASIFFLAYFAATKTTWHLLIIKSNWKAIGLMGLFDAAGSLLFAYGILVSGPTNASFVIQFTIVFSILFGVVFLAERMTKREFVGVLVALGGLFFLAYGNAEVELISTLAVLVAAVFFATVNMFSKFYVQNIPPFSLAAGRSFFIFIYLTIFALLFGRLELAVPPIAFGYAVLGSITGMIVSFILFYKALEVWEISKTATLRSMEPFLTAIFSFIILSLMPTANQFIGGLLIVLGVVVLSLTREKTGKPTEKKPTLAGTEIPSRMECLNNFQSIFTGKCDEQTSSHGN
ncbi:MAG: DMT family transporter [Candidatus Bathyarchaeota archaeon]|nr:DMT family transporter [Candidatus Bathyarchaeota archaeon]